MARKKKAAAEQKQLRIEAEERAWRQFEPRLKALNSLEEAASLCCQAPLPDSPGRQYYSNLGFFLQSLSRPSDASSEENGLYIELVRKQHAAGRLSADTLKKVEDAFSV